MAEEHGRDPNTLTRFIIAEQKKADGSGDLTILLNSVQLACKVISNACNKAGMYNLYGLAGNNNSSGDDVKKLDIYSNDAFINSCKFSHQVNIMASEENEEPIVVSEATDAKYNIVFDPLDGSSNIDANVSIGTIFAIYKSDGTPKSLLQKGSSCVAAGYCMYGAASVLVLTTGQGVNGFTLDPSLGEFILTHRNIQIPKRGKIFSVNEGNSQFWRPAIAEYVESCKRPANGAKPMSARYIGSMVADVHRTLLYGGIFMYPGDSKSPNGKLRLVYEGNPMAFIVEQAGGLASTGHERILDLEPARIHERRPVFMGSPDNVQDVLRIIAKHKQQ